MVSLFLLLGCNLSYTVDLFAALHELASAQRAHITKARIIGARALKTLWRHFKFCQKITEMHLETPKKDEDGTICHQLYNWLKPYLFSAKTLFFITKVTLATVGCTFIHGKNRF